MNEVTRLCELEAECRLRALSEPDKKWYWLAQAAKYQVQASQKIAFRFEKPASARTSTIQTARLLRLTTRLALNVA